MISDLGDERDRPKAETSDLIRERGGHVRNLRSHSEQQPYGHSLTDPLQSSIPSTSSDAAHSLAESFSDTVHPCCPERPTPPGRRRNRTFGVRGAGFNPVRSGARPGDCRDRAWPR